MKKQIEAFIFDYGGVISTDQDPEVLSDMVQLIGAELDAFKINYRKHRRLYDLNKISAQDYWQIVLKEHDVIASKSLLQKFIDLDIKSWTNINSEMVNFIKGLDKKGVNISMVSNMTIETLGYMRSHFNWLAIFNPAIFSCEHGFVKPDKEIYINCLERLGLSADKCVFIDDTVENIKGASNIGLNTVLFNNTQNFINELDSKYVFN